MATINSTDTDFICPLPLWSPSAVDERRSALYVCIIATFIHFLFWLQLVFYSSARQKTMQWLYAYLVTDILLLFRFFLLFIAHTTSDEYTTNMLWANFVCYFEAFGGDYLNVLEVYILLALNICRYAQIAYNKNVYITDVRSLICAHLVIYLMPIINFIVQTSVDWAELKIIPGDSCYIEYISIYVQTFNIILDFGLPISLNILVICASIRHVQLTSGLRRAQHHVTAREKYHRSLVIQFLVFYTVWILLWSPNVIGYQFISEQVGARTIVRFLNYIEITLDPIIIAALDIRFWKLWRHIWIQLKNRYFQRLQRQRRQIHPIEIDNNIPMNQLKQAVAVK